ncbi:hypothetical protein [Actinoplanes sp. URMC 104]|uniref:hypothetical protein n=1 Tax=Actinoplanes sp. URMC 104 TaxID=3423409 RepID=UPI003F1CCE17
MNVRTTERVVGVCAWAGAWLGLALAPVHALSRFATADGAPDLDSPVVRAWAEPAADGLRPLLSWSDSETVYTTYGRLWTPLILAAVACAVLVRRRREPTGAERWAWRVVLTAYGLMAVSVLGDYFTPWRDESFAYLGIPAVLLGLAGSSVLGVVLYRRGFRPRATAVLLAAWLPLFFGLSMLIAMGAGLLPMLLAWGLAGRSLTRAAPASAPADRTGVRFSQARQ